MQRRNSEQETDTQQPLNIYPSLNYLIAYPNISSQNNSTSEDFTCLFFKPSSLIFVTFCFVNIFLLLPLCMFILHHGFQQWLRNFSFSSTAVVRHSDCLTYHVALLELFGVVGCFLCIFGVLSNHPTITSTGYSAYTFTCFGESFFHIMMCLEHYSAVAYPIAYMSLRNKKGVKIRNICFFCTWLLCLTGKALMQTIYFVIAINLLLLTTAIIVNSFCCLSVLCFLIHPGPGKHGGDKDSREHLKYRAFYTILAILGVLVLRFALGLLWILLTIIKGGNNCLMMTCNAWVNLPSSLVLPLLFLQRTGQCVCQKTNNK